MNIYGIYKNIRNSTWQCLIDYQICELPVDIKGIARKAHIKIIKNSDVYELAPSESGASVFDGEKWFIIYDDEDTEQRARFTVAHELGHIFLGHELKKGYHARTIDKDKPQVETEADIFASRLLAPACVLWGLNLHTSEEIARICNISKTAAKVRADRMAILYERQKFLTSPLEKKLFEQFKEYIEQNKK